MLFILIAQVQYEKEREQQNPCKHKASVSLIVCANQNGPATKG